MFSYGNIAAGKLTLVFFNGNITTGKVRLVFVNGDTAALETLRSLLSLKT